MIYLFSNFTDVPKQYFSGYGFSKSNYMSGDFTDDDFEKINFPRVIDGGDGCYFSIREEGGVKIAGSDASGLKKVFWYDDGVNWGVSNSIYGLAKHLSDNGVGIRANPTFLESFNSPIFTVTDQLSAFKTMYSGIRLLPLGYNLIVGKSGLTPIRRTVQRVGDYAEALAEAIELWISRFETLLINPDVRLTCDLTGGKDSRVVFALLQKARERLGKDVAADVVIYSDSTPRQAADHAVAKSLTERFGMELNQNSQPTSNTRLTGGAVYEIWRNLNIGAYHPIYFPRADNSPFRIKLHGGGGETLRKFYAFKDFSSFSAKALENPGRHDLSGWIDAVEQSYAFMTAENPNVDPWILHYRNFRNRFQVGLFPQYFTTIEPFNTEIFCILSEFEGKVAESQIHFDIMESLYPGLCLHPYDDPRKAPSERALKNITKVPVSNSSAPGNCYFSHGVPYNSEVQSNIAPFEHLRDDFEKARRFGVEGLMPQIFADADAVLQKATEAKRFAHAFDARPVSRVLSMYFAHSLG